MRYLLLASIFAICTAAKPAPDYLDYVDPLIGSDIHGHVFVGANVPFGTVQVGPQNANKGWDWCSGYHYSDSVVIGFSHTHLSGTGCEDLGDVLIMPYMGEIRTRRGDKNSLDGSTSTLYSHENESVSPDYYSLLMDNGIKAELTSTTRTAFHRYTFPDNNEPARVLVNLREAIGGWSISTEIKLVDPYTIEGHRIAGGFCPEHRVFFVLKSNVPIKELPVFEDDKPVGMTSAKGQGTKGVLTFEKSPKQLMLKVAISSVSCANAAENLAAEISHWDFEKVRADSRKLWNRELSRVDISASERDKKVFYTAMYHTMIAPTTYCDVNGEFMGNDRKTHKTEKGVNYSTFSLWDTYRTLHPLYTFLHPERTADIINSMIAICDQQGKLPVWVLLGGETNMMPGYSGVAVVADAAIKGIEGVDVERAYQACKKSVMNRSQRHIHYVLDKGFIPADKEGEATSIALEYAVSDWAVGALAHKLNKTEDAAYFAKRGRYYEQYYDKSIGFVRPKNSDGSWMTPYDPFNAKHGGSGAFCEGTGWQYTFFVPQHPEGLIDILGGDERFLVKLDSLFIVEGFMGEGASGDITGLIGQYAHGNEPSHHIAYMYAYAGAQWKSAKFVRQIQTSFYTDKPDGIIGNEDCGQMSAWHVMSALGFYQVNPSNGVFVFGSPLFKKATINLPKGKSFTVESLNNSDENIYIQKAMLNGKPYQKSYVTYDQIMSGGKLKFVMGNKPNKLFGASKENRPSSLY